MNQPKIVIPARFASTRLPQKPLKEIAGKPLIQWVYERASSVEQFEAPIIATDHADIAEVCEQFGATVLMTRSDHQSGTDRLAEVMETCGWSDDSLIINLQGDEPLTPIANLYQLAQNLQAHSEAAISTLATPITSTDELNDPNLVKVVRDQHGFALYFSRSPIPYDRDTGQHQSALRHIGMYGYRGSFLKAYQQLPQGRLEQLEKLEQLRAMEHGYHIHVAVADEVPGPGVDTQEDLERVAEIIELST